MFMRSSLCARVSSFYPGLAGGTQTLGSPEAAGTRRDTPREVAQEGPRLARRPDLGPPCASVEKTKAEQGTTWTNICGQIVGVPTEGLNWSGQPSFVARADPNFGNEIGWGNFVAHPKLDPKLWPISVFCPTPSLRIPRVPFRCQLNVRIATIGFL